MNTTTRILALSITALCLLGCPSSGPADEGVTPSAGTEADAPTLDPRVERAIEVAAAIEENPNDAEGALVEFEMSVDEFEGLMIEISADPDLSAQFKAARGGD